MIFTTKDHTRSGSSGSCGTVEEGPAKRPLHWGTASRIARRSGKPGVDQIGNGIFEATLHSFASRVKVNATSNPLYRATEKFQEKALRDVSGAPSFCYTSATTK